MTCDDAFGSSRRQVQLSPLRFDAPGGMNSMMTSFLKPVLPIIFYMQFMYLYRWDFVSVKVW